MKCTWESFWQIFNCKVIKVAVNNICEVLQFYAGKEVHRPDFTLQEIMENYMKVIKLAYSMFANLEQMQNKLDMLDVENLCTDMELKVGLFSVISVVYKM